MSGDGQQVSAHKLILAANSEVLKGILKQNPHACPLIYLRGVKHSDLLLLLGFMYTGEVTLEQQELGSFLKTAEDLKVKGLGARAGGSGGGGKEVVTARPQKQRPAKVRPQPPLEVAMVKTETGNMEAGEEEGAGGEEEGAGGEEEGAGGVQNLLDNENNSYEDYCYEEMEVSGRQEAGERVIMNPTSDQRNKVFGQYMKALLKEGKPAWKCLVCGKEFPRKGASVRHVEAMHNDIVHQVFQYKCRYCSKVLNTISQLGCHETRDHKRSGV